MRVLVQLRSSPRAIAATGGGDASASFTREVAASVSGIVIDHAYGTVPIPTPQPRELGGNPYSLSEPRTFSTEPSRSTYLVRGTIADATATQDAVALAMANPDVIGVFADPAIETCPICPGDPAKGTDGDVEKALHVKQLAHRGLDGSGVLLAIVDTGVNTQHLRNKGRTPLLDVPGSWTPAGTPGTHAVGHGTMCAYDAGIAAPQATLLDHAVLLSQRQGGSVMAGLLSDAVLSFSKLLTMLLSVQRAKRAMVVSNSWGMFSPNWDFPIGHPGNYSDNPAHPFNVIVSSLENAGADILFAAGNCGLDCPDGRCQFGTTRPICGANSHPAAYSIGGVDVDGTRVGYSSQGPGRLSQRKPDICAYTHFAGSGVYAADGGTSAACPVAAGVVAAVRSKFPVGALSPLQLRSLIQRHAKDAGRKGFDYNYGWGILQVPPLLGALGQVAAEAEIEEPTEAV